MAAFVAHELHSLNNKTPGNCSPLVLHHNTLLHVLADQTVIYYICYSKFKNMIHKLYYAFLYHFISDCYYVTSKTIAIT